ncbi:RNA helicase aquarius-like [Anneissia japonica]|uniref:RNA helicase aquarius-like n=1 Tax=Anneissia japonica TaxID=1529436 RepID=UPI0014256874|nr:RNA helicase aquarius-like [Anneissia japonica]
MISLQEQTLLLTFLVHCFNSLGVDLIREQVQRLVSLPMWASLLETRLEQELKKDKRYRKFWNVVKKNDGKADEETRKRNHFERHFLASLIKRFYKVLDLSLIHI